MEQYAYGWVRAVQRPDNIAVMDVVCSQFSPHGLTRIATLESFPAKQWWQQVETRVYHRPQRDKALQGPLLELGWRPCGDNDLIMKPSANESYEYCELSLDRTHITEPNLLARAIDHFIPGFVDKDVIRGFRITPRVTTPAGWHDLPPGREFFVTDAEIIRWRDELDKLVTILEPDGWRVAAGDVHFLYRSQMGTPGESNEAHSNTSIVRELRELGELRESGVISEQEFESIKANLLAKWSPDALK
jgi:hypothetical protein